MSVPDLEYFKRKMQEHEEINATLRGSYMGDPFELPENNLEAASSLGTEDLVNSPTKFKVGDKVRVVKKVGSYTGGWENNWYEPKMVVGSVGKIEYVNGVYGYRITDTDCNFPSQALELVESAVEAESQVGTEKSLDSHYKYSFNGVKLDPYRILEVYGIANPAQQHAIKKLLRAGKSIKDLKQDIEEVQMTLTRWLEMIEEDGK